MLRQQIYQDLLQLYKLEHICIEVGWGMKDRKTAATEPTTFLILSSPARYLEISISAVDTVWVMQYRCTRREQNLGLYYLIIYLIIVNTLPIGKSHESSSKPQNMQRTFLKGKTQQPQMCKISGANPNRSMSVDQAWKSCRDSPSFLGLIHPCLPSPILLHPLPASVLPLFCPSTNPQSAYLFWQC